MATALSTLITECRHELIDTGGSPRWTDAEFLEYANGAVREIARLRPDEFATTVTLNLAAGTRQALPNAYDRLVELSFNTDDEAIRKVDFPTLKSTLLFAQTEGQPREYAEISGSEFVVYPAVPGGGTTVTAVVIDPQEFTSTGENLDFSDALIPAVVQYMIYRARSKDAEDAVMLQRAQDAYAKFLGLLGVNNGAG